MAATAVQESAAMSAAERRERRKQRILENQDKRMAKILGGVDGEKRAPPCIDGAPEPLKAPVDVPAAPVQASANAPAPPDQTPTDAPKPPELRKIPRPMSLHPGTPEHPVLIGPSSHPRPNEKLLDFADGTPVEENAMREEMVRENAIRENANRMSNVIPRVKPDYLDFMDRARFWIALLIGSLFALGTLFCAHVGSVLLPTLLLIITYEASVFNTKKIFYPKNGYTANAIVAAGLNENLVITMGLLVETLWQIGVDLLVVTFGFISSKFLLGALTGITSPSDAA